MSKKIIISALVAVLIVVGVGTAITYWNSQSNQRDNNPSSARNNDEIETVAENLNTPWSVVFYGDTALISSRDTGEIRELNAENGSTRVIGTIDGVVHRSEGGLLGLAVDDQRRLYAYYTTDSDNRVSRFSLNGEPGNLSLASAETIIKDLPRASTHNGGRIAFGPDDMLYITVGDAGDTRSAQDLTKLSGKILRMTPDGGTSKSNPFPDSFVYSYGHRNPQGLAWSEDGTMYASEFGQNTWDELNVIKAGSNYGWPIVEGIENRDGYIDPVQQWKPSEASPSGMAYADGLLYIANLRGQVLRTVPVDDLSASKELYKENYGRIRDVAVRPDGKIWFITNNTDGRGTPSETDDSILSISRSQ